MKSGKSLAGRYCVCEHPLTKEDCGRSRPHRWLVRTLIQLLVPRAGLELARSYGQPILSPIRWYLPQSTTRYQVVFTDVSAVKASYVRLGIDTYPPHLSLIVVHVHVPHFPIISKMRCALNRPLESTTGLLCFAY